ncbi:MAG: metal-dependent transcriptional regulator [Erysipelotrichaceae bacterium]|nr:metal-dependent transcriptional regulator [Erysipelotrichaceae bacterium]
MKRNETLENYLEAIQILSLNKQGVKAIDVANYLHFARATVSVALKEFERDGYIRFERYNIFLTPKGLKIANAMYERHEYIAQLLMHFGVDEKTAYADSCMIEHDLSQKSFDAIKKATGKIIKK